MMHGKNSYSCTKPHAFGSLSGGDEQHLWVWKHAAEITKVMLGCPEGVEAEIFGGVDLLKPMGVKLRAFTVQFRHVGVENVVSKLHGAGHLGFWCQHIGVRIWKYQAERGDWSVGVLEYWNIGRC